MSIKNSSFSILNNKYYSGDNVKRLLKKISMDADVYDELQLMAINESELKGIFFKPFINPEIDEGIMREALFLLEECQKIDSNIYIYLKDKFCKNNKEARYLIEEIKDIIKVLETDNTHDQSNRTYAMVYFNGKFYEGIRHAECIDDAMNEQNRETLEHTDYRPNKSQMDDILQQEDVMFCAHVVENPYKTETYDGTDNYNSIYIMTEPELLKNVTFEQIKKIINSSMEYNRFHLYLDQNSYIDYRSGFREYPSL